MSHVSYDRSSYSLRLSRQLPEQIPTVSSSPPKPIVPKLVGIFFSNGVVELGVAVDELTRNQCHPRAIAELSDNLQSVCGEVYSQSLQSAMVIMASLYAAGSLFFLLTWPRLDKDMVDRNPS